MKNKIALISASSLLTLTGMLENLSSNQTKIVSLEDTSQDINSNYYCSAIEKDTSFNKDTSTTIYFNESRDDVYLETFYPASSDYQFRTIIIPLSYFPLKYNFIKFYSKDNIDSQLNAYFSWGNTGYYNKGNINDAIPIGNLAPYIFNQKSFDIPNFANICNEKITYLAAVLRVRIDLGFSFYYEKGTWYFQIIVRHYAEKWGSSSGGRVETKLGNRFVLSSKPID